MRREYDFSKSRTNPYASQLKKQITIRLDEESIDYFKSISDDTGVPYQSLINFYLRDCAASRRKLSLVWKKTVTPSANGPSRKTADEASSSHRSPKTASETIIAAIKAKRTLTFNYNGKKRVVEPQCIGIGAKNTELLRGHQISGGAQREPLFDVSRISDLVVLDERFPRPGPNYKKNDSAMKTILAQL